MSKKYSKLNLFLRSSIFWMVSITSICLWSLVVTATIFLPLKFRYKAIRVFLRFIFVALKFICHIDYKVEGLENIVPGKIGIALSKHQSTWETFFLPLIILDPAVIVKRELLFIPFFGWALAASEPISINRKKKSSAMQQIIEKGSAFLASGRWILMFPEGTRVAPGKVGNYKMGGARLAAATGYPIYPIAHNAGRFWPRRKFIKKPGTVHLVVGPPIPSEGRTPEELLAETKNWIESTMTRIDRK